MNLRLKHVGALALFGWIGLWVGEAQATCFTQCTGQLAMSDCSVPPSTKWPKSKPLQMTVACKTCCAAPGGPSNCSATAVQATTLRVLQLVQPPTFLAGTFSKVKDCKQGELFKFSSMLAVGSYEAVQTKSRLFGFTVFDDGGGEPAKEKASEPPAERRGSEPGASDAGAPEPRGSEPVADVGAGEPVADVGAEPSTKDAGGSDARQPQESSPPDPRKADPPQDAGPTDSPEPSDAPGASDRGSGTDRSPAKSSCGCRSTPSPAASLLGLLLLLAIARRPGVKRAERV